MKLLWFQCGLGAFHLGLSLFESVVVLVGLGSMVASLAHEALVVSECVFSPGLVSDDLESVEASVNPGPVRVSV